MFENDVVLSGVVISQPRFPPPVVMVFGPPCRVVRVCSKDFGNVVDGFHLIFCTMPDVVEHTYLYSVVGYRYPPVHIVGGRYYASQFVASHPGVGFCVGCGVNAGSNGGYSRHGKRNKSVCLQCDN